MTINYASQASAAFTSMGATKRLLIPTTVVPGSFMLFGYTGSDTQPDANPSGWTLLQQQTGGTVRATWWWRVATNTDPGTYVTVPAVGNAKTALTLTVFTGVDTAAPVAASAVRSETTASATHADPAMTLPGGYNGKIVRALALKDTSTAVSGVWQPGTGATTPPVVRSTASTAGTSQTVGVQASGVSDTSTYTARSWSVFAANGTTPVASPHAVTLALALTAAGATPPPSASGYRGAMTGGNSGETATTTTAVLTLPGSAAAGDTALVITSSNLGAATVVPPAGWHQEIAPPNVIAANNKAYLFSKTLTTGDITTGTVTLTWSSAGRNIASGVVLYGLDPTQPFKTIGYTSGTVASLAAPVVSTGEADAQVLTLTSCRTATGAPSVPTYPSGWTRRTNIASNFATTGVNMSCSIATLDTPGAAGSYGGETVAFSGPGTTSDSSEQVYTVACQTTAQLTTRLLFQRSGADLRAVTLARREGSSVVLL